jgi:hypothetical protein
MNAFKEGKQAYRDGVEWRDCPYPAPYRFPRSSKDLNLPEDCDGAYWLDGWAEEEGS